MRKPTIKKPVVQEEAPLREITVKRDTLTQWGQLSYNCPECNLGGEVVTFDMISETYWCRRATCNLRFRVIDG